MPPGRVLLDGDSLYDEAIDGTAYLLVVGDPGKSVHCARVKTPPWKQARAIRSARRPVQPKGSSAFARPLNVESHCYYASRWWRMRNSRAIP